MSLIQLIEADIHQERTLKNTVWKSPQAIERWLKKHGFNKLGHGAFSSVFHRPGAKRVVRISNAEDRCFNSYLNWLIQLKANPHVPKVSWVKEYKGTRNGKPQIFTVAIVELLEPISAQAILNTVDFVAVVEMVTTFGEFSDKSIVQAVKQRLEQKGITTLDQAGQWLDRHHNNRFSYTMNTIHNMSEKTNCGYDMHEGNFMYRSSTRNIVVTDPLADIDGITIDTADDEAFFNDPDLDTQQWWKDINAKRGIKHT